jgi:hypothetical protein
MVRYEISVCGLARRGKEGGWASDQFRRRGETAQERTLASFAEIGGSGYSCGAVLLFGMSE